MEFALIGNQNCGKTTLFNQLTGSNQHVGNFPGVTVEQKSGFLKKNKDVSVVDLPGIYSLSPYTAEEVVTRDFLIKTPPDAIINIVDATNIERNLYLSLQVMELNIPTVLAFNMMDEIRANNTTIHIKELSERLGVPIVPISASKNEGIFELVDAAITVAKNKQKPKVQDFCQGPMHVAIHSIAHILEEKANRIGVPKRYAATKVIEGDPLTCQRLALTSSELHSINHIIEEMETELGTDREAAMADMRYTFIENACHDTVITGGENVQHARSVKIDKVLTHKVFAIPIFLCIMLTVFYLTFGVIGAYLSDLLSAGINAATETLDTALRAAEVNEALRSLVIDGVCSGIGSVLSFLPIIVVLFYFLSILEDSGYMARVAFVMDKLLRKIGLSGKSFVPMLIGFGCSVPAIIAARTLSSRRDRVMTILLTPFMSCSAKLTIYALFTAAFFPKHGALVMLSLYVLGIVLAVIIGYLMKNTLFKGNPVPFVLELPSYRFPSIKTTLLLMWDKAKDFITKAFTVIFMATIIIWVLQTFDVRFNMVTNSESSILACLSRAISPIFKPLGFSDWKTTAALITGFTAKEAVVSTMAVLNGASQQQLLTILPQTMTALSAYSFLVFTLLYTPCAAAIAAVKKELGGARYAFLVMVFQTAVAYFAAFVIYNIGRLFFI